MEKSPQSVDPINLKSESVANFEGNDGLLLIERISNPIIRNQIIELSCQNETIEYTDKDFKMDLSIQEKSGDPDGLGRDGLRSNAIQYLFSGPEVAERMSQLKNYFGIKDSEHFTREHLEYARQHYITDTGMDNRMRHFFQAITPETEVAFIELINSSGI